MSKRKRWEARLYIGRDAEGKQQFEWLGRFPTKRERDAAIADARMRRKRLGGSTLPTVAAEVDAYLAWYLTRYPKSIDIQTERLKRFRADFAERSIDLNRAEIKRWAAAEGEWSKHKAIPNGYLFAVSAFYTFAMDEDDLPLERNPARKLAKQSNGRADEDPPTEEEFAALLKGCAALGDYGPTMRALLEFAAFTLMRPGELFALEWSDIDFETMRIQKRRRVYRGKVAEPKTGRKEIALTPPARDAIMSLVS